MIGKILNHFKVLDRLGKGGMGEVYVAEDSKLKRRVALKVLPEEVARDPARLDRFQREAETIAALNHPNIVTIYFHRRSLWNSILNDGACRRQDTHSIDSF